MKDIIDALGHLHDAHINRIDVDVVNYHVVVSIGDMLANFRNNDDPGEFPGEIRFLGISGLDIQLAVTEQITVYGIQIGGPSDDGHPFKLAVSPGGYISGHARQILVHPADVVEKNIDVINNWKPGNE